MTPSSDHHPATPRDVVVYPREAPGEDRGFNGEDMRMRSTMFTGLVIATALAAGCSKPAANAPTTAGPDNASDEAADPAATPEGGQVVCHLDCSGTEATGQGATEEEARADVSRYIDENCKPEDGQYFIFCDPPQ